jgi:glucose/mannose-6-phosphate isomerase
VVNFLPLIKKLDKNHVLDSISALPFQCEQAWNDIKKLKLPDAYKKINNIIVCGMGGSALGTDFLRYVFYSDMNHPVVIVNNYQLPGYSSNKSLVIISSYSGNTEETVACFNQAIKKKSKIIVLATGGKITKKAKQAKLPAYIFDPKFNPSDEPRMGLGYSIMAQIGILKKLNLVNLSEKEIKKAIANLTENRNIEMSAKKIAEKLYGKIPIIFAAEHLSGNAHILANQINENAKTFAAYFILPELNHHLLEGLSFPKKKSLIFLILESQNYYKRVQKRIDVTKKVIKKFGFSYLSYQPQTFGKLSESLELLSFGGYLSYYLGLLYKVDPSRIPIVDYFKNQLAKE